MLLCAHATGTFSSRRIARKLEEDVAYRVLAARNVPAHRTIAEFRQQHLAAFEALFVQVAQVARAAGVVRLGALAADGSKVKADAVDAAEDAAHATDVRGDELPAALQRREAWLATIAAAQTRLEARQTEEDRE